MGRQWLKARAIPLTAILLYDYIVQRMGHAIIVDVDALLIWKLNPTKIY